MGAGSLGRGSQPIYIYAYIVWIRSDERRLRLGTIIGEVLIGYGVPVALPAVKHEVIAQSNFIGRQMANYGSRNMCLIDVVSGRNR